MEQGFWSIYDSMTLVGLTGIQIGGKAADGIATVVGADGTVTVCGHSLGSAIATYLSYDVAKLSERGRAPVCSLRRAPAITPGRQAMTRRSPTIGSSTTSSTSCPTCRSTRRRSNIRRFAAPQILQPATARAEVRFDIRCNHNLVCYCAMLDFADTKKRASAQDIEAWRCILGPPAFGLNRELTLALDKPVIALEENGAVMRNAGCWPSIRDCHRSFTADRVKPTNQMRNPPTAPTKTKRLA